MGHRRVSTTIRPPVSVLRGVGVATFHHQCGSIIVLREKVTWLSLTILLSFETLIIPSPERGVLSFSYPAAVDNTKVKAGLLA